MRISDLSSDVCSSDLDYSAVSDLDDFEFCRWLTIEKGVTAIPLSPFYESPPPGQRLVRLCFAKNEATLDAATERLQKLSAADARKHRFSWVRLKPRAFSGRVAEHRTTSTRAKQLPQAFPGDPAYKHTSSPPSTRNH